MQSKSPTVSAYLDEVPANRRPALEHLRQPCQTHLAGFEENMT